VLETKTWGNGKRRDCRFPRRCLGNLVGRTAEIRAPSGSRPVHRKPPPEAFDIVAFATQTLPPAYLGQALLSAFLIVTIFRNRGVGASAMAVTTGRALKPNFS
jgi:hypothetical protein